MRKDLVLKVVLAAGVVEAVVAGAVYAAGGGVAGGGAQVPLPGSLALIVTGVAGLVGASWWLRRK